MGEFKKCRVFQNSSDFKGNVVVDSSDPPFKRGTSPIHEYESVQIC